MSDAVHAFVRRQRQLLAGGRSPEDAEALGQEQAQLWAAAPWSVRFAIIGAVWDLCPHTGMWQRVCRNPESAAAEVWYYSKAAASVLVVAAQPWRYFTLPCHTVSLARLLQLPGVRLVATGQAYSQAGHLKYWKLPRERCRRVRLPDWLTTGTEGQAAVSPHA